jgi:hypothetical protein
MHGVASKGSEYPHPNPLLGQGEGIRITAINVETPIAGFQPMASGLRADALVLLEVQKRTVRV